MKFTQFFFRLLLPMIVFAANSFAWGPAGHEIVAEIASLHLTPRAQAGIAELLGPNRHISDNGIANWPDFIRHDRPETGPWHFVDIPFAATGYVPQRDCKDGQCVIDQVTHFASVLGDTNATVVTRAEAIRFLIHFVADLHQPLHCAERNGDHGGNLRTMSDPHDRKPSNLHKIWDNELVHECLGDQSIAAFARGLNARATPAEQQEWVRGTVANWAWASHELAVKHVYKDIPLDGPAVPLTAAYIAANRPIVELQLTKAGLRLAYLLNQAFR